MSDSPTITRIRHELKRRRLQVARVERLAPKMIRVVLSGDELQGFTSLGFDDHVKLFFPLAAVAGQPSHAMRDFTPRHFDSSANELWIDFFLHESGPATAWSAQATPGQVLEVGGPKSSAVIAIDGIDSHVFIGDETALPAIARRLQELPATARALVVIEIEPGAQWPDFSAVPKTDVVWVTRGDDTDTPARELIDALTGLQFPPGQCFVWMALESRSARAVRRYLREERGLGKQWIKAAGYWRRGVTGTHDTLAEDD